ncbi:hypothetical protein [Streptococcus gallolyticus]|nr:hypothetical protein [Streptococcus gallolyticus]MCY7185733.1 hypothetical protein [Streptococcus gallolyticus subsp. gallolyticus]MCY7188947.1 hypothetical protein [Streptococcus gallolyticus subsp. gallolyticus]
MADKELNTAENDVIAMFNQLKAGQKVETDGKDLTLDEGKTLLESK